MYSVCIWCAVANGQPAQPCFAEKVKEQRPELPIVAVCNPNQCPLLISSSGEQPRTPD
nr:MAG TPA: hypothetical protein [Bacteriophage sp.]